MLTLALPKSVFSFVLGLQRLLALSELAYLIKKIFFCLQASAAATLAEAVPDYWEAAHLACSSRCRKGPIGVEHALSCLSCLTVN